MVDARKTLAQLNDEWSSCTKCDLGTRRVDDDLTTIPGEGVRRGIMFIGDGPSLSDAYAAKPFQGEDDDGTHIVRKVINKLGLENYYLTNCVACRSCKHREDNSGNLMFRKNYRTGEEVPYVVDEAPNDLQTYECNSRLLEEIYLVDPIVIVALGADAAKAIGGKKVKINTEHGVPVEVEIPGAWSVPVLTEKRKIWSRKRKGELVRPTEPNKVKYLMVPVIHPNLVERRHKDMSYGNPVQTFFDDIKHAVAIYDRYMVEVHGCVPTQREREYSDG